MVNIPVIQDIKTSPFGEFLGGIGTGIGGGVGDMLKQKIIQNAFEGVDLTDSEDTRRAVLGLPPALQQQALGVIGATTPKVQKPPLTANEQINQVGKRQRENLEQLMRPYTIMDPISKMMAFRGDVKEDKKQELMDQAQEVINRGRSAISTIYQRAGLELPSDIGAVEMAPEEYRNILSGAGGTGEMSLDQALKSKQKMKPDPNNPNHQSLVQQAVKRAKGDKEKTNKILEKIFE